jgi:hypothetical protein
MRKILEAIGSRISKRYRIYGRKLGQEIQPGK